MANIPFLNNAYFTAKVGIGKPVPTKPLDVIGNAQVEGTFTVKTANNNIRLLDSNDNTVNFSVGVNGRFQVRDVNAGTSPFQIEKAAPNDSLFIKANSNVGIKNNNPQSTLHLGDNANSIGGTLRLDSFVANQFWKLEPGTNTLNIKDYDGTSLASFDGAGNYVLFNGGNVGIGVTGPTAKLHVSGGTKLLGGAFAVSTDAAEGANIFSYKFRDAVGINNPNSVSAPVVAGYVMSVGRSTSGSVGGGIYVEGESRFVRGLAGGIKFNAYDGTNQVGTPTYILGTDAAGNVVKVLGSSVPGSVSGSGTLNKIPLWTPNSSTIGDSMISQVTTSNVLMKGAGNDFILSLDPDNNAIGDTSTVIFNDRARVGWFNSAVYLGDGGSNKDIKLQTNLGDIISLTSNTERMRIKFDTGKVGIGTTTPVEQLTVFGQVASTSSSSTVNTAGANRAIMDLTGGGARMGHFRGATAAGSGFLRLFTDSVERMRIDSAGNVGIDITNPVSYGKFVVQGTGNLINANASSGAATFQLYEGGQGRFAITTLNGSAGAKFELAGNEKMRITSVGNVGIGITNPTEKLVIDGKVIIKNIAAPKNHAQLNIGYTGSGETRAIDIHGDWSANESKSITFTHGSAATNMVGQINCVYNNPGSSIKWGKLYHSGDSSTYTMELASTSATTANLTVAGKAISAATVAADSSTTLTTKGYVDSLTPGAGVFLPLAGGTMTAGAVVTFLDSSGSTDDRLKFGSSGDMQLFHDGAASHIVSISSELRIDAPTFIVRPGSGTETMIKATQNAAVELYYDNTKRFETTSAGIAVSGSITIPEYIVHQGDPNTFIGFPAGDRVILHAGGNSNVELISNGVALRHNGGTRLETISAGVAVSGNLTVSGDATLGNSTADNHTINGQVTHLTADALGYKLYRSSGSTSMLISATGDSEIEFGTDNGSGTNTTRWTIGKDSTDNSFRISNSASLGTSDTLTLAGANATFAGTVTAGSYFLGDDTSISLATTGAGTVFLRPNGQSSTAQSSFTTTLATIGTSIAITGAATATTATTSTDNNATLTTKGYVDGLVTGVPVYKGTWDARNIAEGGATDGGNPDLRLAANKVLGNYYIVSTAGSASPNGGTTEPNSWNVGDWCIFSDVTPGAGTDLWQKIDNTSVISGAGTGQKVTKWEGTSGAASETLTDGPITFSGNNSTFAATSSALTVIARDNLFVDAGQLYIGADNGSTDNSYRQTVSTSAGTFKLQKRISGTFTDVLSF